MLKLLTTFFCVISCYQTSPVFSEQASQHQDIKMQQVQECLNDIRKLPEVRELMSQIQKEGPIRFAISDHSVAQQFKAYWDVEERVICVSATNHSSKGELIGSLIFEMHNAAINSEIEKLDHLVLSGQLDKESYVRAMEHLEYLNSKKASAIVEKGIQTGLFPKSARLNTYQNFEEHYYYQQISGHSACVGKIYDQLAG